MPHKSNRQQLGEQAECLARHYLEQQGLVFINHNFHSRFGEIDLIMQDQQQQLLIFVEVRYRKNTDFGGAVYSITPAKQRKIIKTALYYLQTQAPQASARFDVITIEGDIQNPDNLNWIIDAFQAYS